MLGQRRRRWANIKATMFQFVVFAGIIHQNRAVPDFGLISLKLYTINNQTVFGNVEITFNSSRLDEALFVVIHFRSIYKMDVPKTRHPWQRWVVHTMERPSYDGLHKLQAHGKPLEMIDTMFNFTSHYSKISMAHVALCGVHFLNSRTFVEDINFTCLLKTNFVKST